MPCVLQLGFTRADIFMLQVFAKPFGLLQTNSFLLTCLLLKMFSLVKFCKPEYLTVAFEYYSQGFTFFPVKDLQSWQGLHFLRICLCG